MTSLNDYFSTRRYLGKYKIGDRVFGRWNQIPFIGSVGNDSIVSENSGPRITITLDLPIKFQGRLHHILIVEHKDVTPLKQF